jgi:hypothetical protein
MSDSCQDLAQLQLRCEEQLGTCLPIPTLEQFASGASNPQDDCSKRAIDVSNEIVRKLITKEMVNMPFPQHFRIPKPSES